MRPGTIRDIFASFQKNLLSRLPHNEIEQILDEAHWQYESLCENEGNQARFRTNPFLKSFAVVVALQRALKALGFGNEQARELSAEAVQVGRKGLSSAAALLVGDFFVANGLEAPWRKERQEDSPDWTGLPSAQTSQSGRA